MSWEEALDVLNRVASIINHACSLACMKRVCSRLYQALSQLPTPESDTASLYANMLAGVLEAAYDNAIREGCTRGASLLREALMLLEDLVEGEG